ncbi:S8 family serine peptidase [Argonema antarcticum]|uniref:S8 family serine peptidase n=1 Tax=Argonema antarcticum TaxID=2942763 RepID=UPI002012B1FF|nr:S8 family serine peptidase [Argonema antarcticum]MCL1471575.1 S8 family serine peptidase [Argonema antarcticum A004/B2]
MVKKNKAWIVLGLSATCLCAPVVALNNDSSVGESGIDALRLQKPPYNLTGRKIAIGQVEIGRPGQFGVDKAGSQNHLVVAVTRVFWRDTPAKTDTDVDPHAFSVAGMMISTSKAVPGVAPGARLYSSAVGSMEKSGQAEECLASQYVAQQNGGDVRSINYSFGESLERDPRGDAAVLDGNALLTQCIDWSARVYDVLHLVAGNQGKGGIPIPTDNFNGINVAFTKRVDGVFSKVDFANIGDIAAGIVSRLAGKEINVGGRRSIGIVAPGHDVTVLNLDGTVNQVSGTSLATPHVTASVALIQEFGDRQLSTRQPHWSLDSRRHEVTKVVFLNSADKLKDTGDGLRLGMTKTITDKSNRTWLDSDAYKDEKIPLDLQMGTGQLNATRAVQQFGGSQWKPSEASPPIGWDYNKVEANASVDYVLDKPLQQGSFASITLAWDRMVELNDTDNNNQYDIGETFRDRGLNNLDLYLIPADTNDNGPKACASVSEVDSVEHIFCPVPKTGRYKIRVQYRQKVNEASQPYALAWWTVPAK